MLRIPLRLKSMKRDSQNIVKRTFAGVETPAAAITPPSSLPVSLDQARAPLTAVAMLSVSKTFVSKNLVFPPQISFTNSWASSTSISRMATYPPARQMSSTHARPRPEALHSAACQ